MVSEPQEIHSVYFVYIGSNSRLAAEMFCSPKFAFYQVSNSTWSDENDCSTVRELLDVARHEHQHLKILIRDVQNY